jgi:Predicted nucleotide-binding protein containing TIR-like domain
MPVPAGSVVRPFPAHTLEKALIVINAIADKGASKAMDRLLVADAIGRTPSSSEFKRLLSSSRAYGLTIGTEKADKILPTELGLKIVRPVHTEEALQAKVSACLTVELLAKVWRQFNRQKLPDAKFLKNTLERSYGLSAEYAEEFAALIVENAKFCGILQDVSGSKYIRMDEPSLAAASGARADQSEVEETEEPGRGVVTPLAPLASPAPVLEKRPKLFLAHGKNMKPLEELKKILDGFGIQYVVAVDEPHAGRPISAKVAQLMNDCTAGIFVFTKDELFFRKQKSGELEEVWRPSENVIYELGAAGILWEKKIIILREDGVNFPSDFSDLGYITFKEGDISAKAMEIMKELITFKLLILQAAA